MTYPVIEIRKIICKFRNSGDSFAMETGHMYVTVDHSH